MSCEVFNENDFGMVEGCQQVLSVDLYNILGEAYKGVIIDSVEWRMSKYGEIEALVIKKSSDGSITFIENIIEILISSEDTQGLHGKFTHQLLIKDGNGQSFVADLGKISIKPQIK